jgi:hypothetical protein
LDRLSGEIALARGRRAEGVALIERAARVTTLWDWNDSLAYALESTGKPEAALDKRIRLADAKGLLWISAERRLPGMWASNISALIRLAGALGRTDALQHWSAELHELQKN